MQGFRTVWGGGNVPMILEARSIGNGQLNQISMSEKANALDCMHDHQAVLMSGKPPRKYIVRRLTPTECGRLEIDVWIPVVRSGSLAGEFMGSGWVKVHQSKSAKMAAVVFGSNENGMEHVSVSFRDRIPTWEEMCVVKDVFWTEEEACIQVHPRKSEYVNIHENCLHIWRKKDAPENWPWE